jgi:hypothetical protein
MKHYLLDLNVLLDIVLKRLPWWTDADAIWTAHRGGQIRALAAAFSLPTIFYIVRQQAGILAANDAVTDCLATLDIAVTDRAALLAAKAMPGSDFEDNLQIACAVQAAVDGIVTRDPQGFTGSPIPVVAPADLVAALSAPPTP